MRGPGFQLRRCWALALLLGASGALAQGSIEIDADPSTDSVADSGPLALEETPGRHRSAREYTVRLTAAPNASVTVTIASADTDAVTVDTSTAAGVQDTLTFTTTNWSTARTVTAHGVTDRDGRDESVQITHMAAGGGYNGVSATLTATVDDGETAALVIDADPPRPIYWGPLLALNEDTGDAANSKGYTVRLATEPTAEVVVAIANGDATAVTLDRSSLTFTAANWRAPQTVTATAQSDADDDDTYSDITHTASGASEYDGLSPTYALRAAVSDDERTGTDYDTDEDNLIEIASLAQLNAVRWDQDGNGAVAAGNATNYGNAFPGASTGMGCQSTCIGYELATHLDFDTDGDGDVDANDPGSYANWAPIAEQDSGVWFQGNGLTIRNLTINKTGIAGLFGNVNGTIWGVGIVDANVRASGGTDVDAGALAARTWRSSRVIASWSSGTVRGPTAGGLLGDVTNGIVAASFSTANVIGNHASSSKVGGLVDGLGTDYIRRGTHGIEGKIIASYATGNTTAHDAGGIARNIDYGEIRASYQTGTVSGSNSSGQFYDQSESDSDWPEVFEDNVCAGSGATVFDCTAQTQAQLNATTGGSPFHKWQNQDIDGDGTAGEAAWDFGTNLQPPALSYPPLEPNFQWGDFDTDDNGLIEVSSLAQLNAMRWDLDGDGTVDTGVSNANAALYRAAFSDAVTAGCPDTDDADTDAGPCIGYELTADLDFDTDDDGSTWALSSGTPTSDSDDAYHNGGTGWSPIGTATAPFNTIFDGKGHVIEHLFVNASANDAGLFGRTGTGAVIRAVGLEDAHVRSTADAVGVLVGRNLGRIAGSWTEGAVRARSHAGGLVGTVGTGSLIVASYSQASVETTGSTGVGGGLSGWNGGGTIRASYSTGAVTGGATQGGFTNGGGTVVASYWDTSLSGIADDTDADPPEGRVAGRLRAPMGYTGLYAAWDDEDVDGDGEAGVAADYDDDAWDFGSASQHPVLKFGGFDTARQFGLQQDDLPPDLDGTVEDVSVRNGVAIDPIQLPEVVGGEGVGYTWTVSGLPAGLSWDVDGSGTCQQARTVCGTPSGTDGDSAVTVRVHDGDSNQADSDRAELTFTITVATPSAAISATSPAALTENNLNGATVTVALTNTTFGSGVTKSSFTLNTNVPGLDIDSVATVTSGDASATLTLDYDGTDFDTARTLGVTVAASAHALAGSLTTATVGVAAGTGVRVAPPRLSLSENPTAGGGPNANQGSYSVVLESQPAGSVTVTATSADAAVTLDADGTPLTYSLTFTTTSWGTAQSVTATAQQDDDAADESVQVTHAVTGYGAVNTATAVAVAVDDDETAAVLIDADPSTANVDESGPVALDELPSAPNNTDAYSVRLSSPPTAAVTVTAASADAGAVTVDTSAASGLQSTLTFTSTNWATGQEVTLAAQQDADGVHESVVVTNTASTAAMSEYTNLSETVTATVEDDEAPGFVFDSDPSTPAVDDAAPLNLEELLSSTTNSDNYSVRLTSQPTQDVTVAITSPDTDAVTVGASALTFTTANWRTAQTVTATAVQDLDGANESVDVSHAASTATNSEYTGITGDFEVAVDDDETPAITLSSASLNVNEQDSAAYTVALATQPTGAVTVSITGVGDGISIDVSSLAFSASNWATARTVMASAADDQNSVNEQVTLRHTAAGAAEYGALTADLQVTALDNDTPSLRVRPTALTVREDGSATYRIRLNTSPSAAVTVTVSGAGSGVTVDTDGATGDQNTLTFTAMTWETEQTVTVSAAADDNGVDEVVALSHAAAGGDYTGLLLTARPGVTVTVDDDDEPAVLIDADPATTNADEPGPLALNELSGHPDNSKGYTVRLATEPTAQVEVTVTSGDRAVSVDTDQTPLSRTLTFTALNWSAAQTVTATAAEDPDASNERVEIAHAADGGDYGGVSARLFATTVDDDEPALVVDAAALTAAGVAEGGSAAYTVRLETEPAGVAVVSIAVTGGVSVDADGDQAGLQRSLRFDAANWNVARTVLVRGLEDDDAAAGMAALRHTSSGADYGRAQAVDVAFAVVDDDTPAVVIDQTAVAVNEGASAAYLVMLATAPSGGAVTVSLSSSDAAAATVSPAVLRFTAGDWERPRRVTVRGEPDVDSTDGSATVSHSVSGGDYGAVTASPVAVAVRDSEAAGVRVEPPRLTVREGGTGRYRVRLNTEPTGDVTVTATGGAELAVDNDETPQERALTFTTENWGSERTVTVEAARDDGAEDGSLTVAHAVSGYAGVATAPALQVQVEDGDEPGFTFDPEGGLSLSEEPADPADAMGSYRVRLATQPSGAVAVEVSSDDAGVEVDTDGTPRTLSLSFDAANWATGQSVSVRAVADADQVGETASLLHTAAGGGYGGVSGTLRVRVADDDRPPAPPPPPPPPPENRPPVVVGSLSDLDLDVGESASVRLGGVFADDGPLSHWAESSDGSVASARVEGNSMLRVRGLSPGAAVVTVWAADVEGQRAQLSFRVSVGRVLSFDPASASAPEGGTLRLRLSLSRPAGAPLSVSWTALPDGDAATADADAADVSALSGTAEFAAGRTEAFIDLEVRDDAEIEPAREVLRVELSPPPEGANWALGRSWALLWIEEGVCDRSPAVRDALRGSRECSAPTSSDLSGRGYLGLHRLDLPALRPKDFLGLTGLRVLHLHGNLLPELPAGLFEGLASLQRLRLDGNLLPSLPEGMLAGLGRLSSLRLDGNRLESLPAGLLSGAPNLERLDLGGNLMESLPPGLFAGVANLGELNLDGNPGAPFALVMRLTRTDAEPWAPGPAWVSAQVAEGAPFAFSAALLAENAEPSAESVSVQAGATSGAPMSVAQEGPGAARLSLSDGPALPATLCGDVQDGRRPCFRGLSAESGPALLLFKPPPSPTGEPPTPALSADGDRASLALDGLFSPAEAGDRLTYAAESNRPDLLSVRIVDRGLVLEANEDGDEGTAVVTVMAMDPDGPSATLSLTVQVEYARVGAAPSWRLEWIRTLRDADQ